jgi:hypothetical protein
MDKPSNSFEQTAPTIKERLLERFKRAKEEVGPNWRKALAEHDPFFDSFQGGKCMDTAAQVLSNGKRGSIDRIARVTLGLEKIAGIEATPII